MTWVHHQWRGKCLSLLMYNLSYLLLLGGDTNMISIHVKYDHLQDILSSSKKTVKSVYVRAHRWIVQSGQSSYRASYHHLCVYRLQFLTLSWMFCSLLSHCRSRILMKDYASFSVMYRLYLFQTSQHKHSRRR